jgi:transposase-like protein
MINRQEKAEALDVMRASVEGTDAQPNFQRLSRQLGVHASTLSRWWGEAQRKAAKGVGDLVMLPPPPKVDDAEGRTFDPLTATELDYWVFRWGQTQAELPNAASDSGRVALLRMQDEVWRDLRAALERARDERGMTPEEIREQLVTAAHALPAALAADVVAVLRKRGIVA